MGLSWANIYEGHVNSRKGAAATLYLFLLERTITMYTNEPISVIARTVEIKKKSQRDRADTCAAA